MLKYIVFKSTTHALECVVNASIQNKQFPQYLYQITMCFVHSDLLVNDHSLWFSLIWP